MIKTNKTNTPKRIVVVSLFSSMDIFLFGCMKAGVLGAFAVEKNFWRCLLHRVNFFQIDDTPVMVNFTEISEEEYRNIRAQKGEIRDTVGIHEGRYVRTKEIQEIDGRKIRTGIEKKYGKNCVIILIGGPPCPDFSKLNPFRNKGVNSRRELVFEFLRVSHELQPDIAIMEQVPDLRQKGNEDVYDRFISKAHKLPYQFAEQEMCSLHYGGNQCRWRYIMLFVHNKYGKQPVFPIPDIENIKRVRDFLDIDFFLAGHRTDSWKTKNHFMPTVTTGNPTKFKKGELVYRPTNDELLLCFDVQSHEYIFPENVPSSQIRDAIGNAVCASLAHALMETILKRILEVQPTNEGWFKPIDKPEANDEE